VTEFAEPEAIPAEGALEPTGVDGRVLRARGARTRLKLLRAAEQAFAELGYHEASIVKITEAAGVGQGTFYLYFRGKQEVFDEVVRDLNLRVRHAMTEAAAKGRTRAEAELLGFRAFFRFSATHPALYSVIRQAEFVSPGVMRYHYERVAEGYVEALEQARRSGGLTEVDPEVLAWCLMGIGELLGRRWIVWGGYEEVPDEEFDKLGRIILRIFGSGDAAE